MILGGSTRRDSLSHTQHLQPPLRPGQQETFLSGTALLGRHDRTSLDNLGLLVSFCLQALRLHKADRLPHYHFDPGR